MTRSQKVDLPLPGAPIIITTKIFPFPFSSSEKLENPIHFHWQIEE